MNNDELNFNPFADPNAPPPSLEEQERIKKYQDEFNLKQQRFFQGIQTSDIDLIYEALTARLSLHSTYFPLIPISSPDELSPLMMNIAIKANHQDACDHILRKTHSFFTKNELSSYIEQSNLLGHDDLSIFLSTLMPEAQVDLDKEDQTYYLKCRVSYPKLLNDTISNRDFIKAKYLIEKYQDFNDYSPIEWCCWAGDILGFKFLRQYYPDMQHNNNSLFESVIWGWDDLNKELAYLLLKEGVDLNTDYHKDCHILTQALEFSQSKGFYPFPFEISYQLYQDLTPFKNYIIEHEYAFTKEQAEAYLAKVSVEPLDHFYEIDIDPKFSEFRDQMKNSPLDFYINPHGPEEIYYMLMLYYKHAKKLSFVDHLKDELPINTHDENKPKV